jgi:hypothetical protein
MGYVIEFVADMIADLERPPRKWVERVRLHRGQTSIVRLMPRIQETSAGPVEAADLYFADGSVAREVPYEQFRFVD